MIDGCFSLMKVLDFCCFCDSVAENKLEGNHTGISLSTKQFDKLQRERIHSLTYIQRCGEGARPVFETQENVISPIEIIVVGNEEKSTPIKLVGDEEQSVPNKLIGNEEQITPKKLVGNEKQSTPKKFSVYNAQLTPRVSETSKKGKKK